MTADWIKHFEARSPLGWAVILLAAAVFVWVGGQVADDYATALAKYRLAGCAVIQTPAGDRAIVEEERIRRSTPSNTGG